MTLSRITLVCVAAGAFLGLIGPLGTGAAPLALRLGYWIVAAVGGGVIGWATTHTVLRWSALHDRTWPLIFTITLLMSLPTTILIWVWGRLAFRMTLSAREWPAFYGSVLLICLVMTTLNRLILVAPSASPASAPAPPEPRSPFLDRLPPRLRDAELYAVEAEDHYLRVHTGKGSDLILLRLADAIGELGAIDGAQTHRSWWVARAAVLSVRRHDGRATLTLKGGLEAPVSRAQAAALRRRGWL
jgi:hypothetical protein